MAICIKCTKFETTLDNELCNSCMGVPAKSSKPAWMSEKSPTAGKEKGSKKERTTKNNIKSDKVKIEKGKKDSNLAFKFKKAIKPLLNSFCNHKERSTILASTSFKRPLSNKSILS